MDHQNSALLQSLQESTQGGTAKQRLSMLFDDGHYTELDRFATAKDRPAEVVCGFGVISGRKVYAFSQDRDRMNGAVSVRAAQKIKRVYELAGLSGTPVIGIYDSAGAYLDEGVDMLASLGDLLHASTRLSGVVPQISVVLGTASLSSAMLAVMADIVIMKDDAHLYITPVSDPENFIGGADVAAKNGSAQIIASSEKEALDCACKLIAMLPQNNTSIADVSDMADPEITDLSEESVVSLNMDDILKSIVDKDSGIELGKDSGGSLKTILAKVGGLSCGVVWADRQYEDGCISINGAKKAARFVRFCDAFSIPVITLLDSVGFSSERKVQVSGAVQEFALLSGAYAEATTVKISVVLGNAVGPVYIAMAGKAANADFVFAWPSSMISSLPLDTAVTILYNDRIANGESRENITKEYLDTKASPFTAAGKGYIDNIIQPGETRSAIYNSIAMLMDKRIPTVPRKHSNLPF